MICAKCGKEIDNDSVYCAGCGAKVLSEQPSEADNSQQKPAEQIEDENEKTSASYVKASVQAGETYVGSIRVSDEQQSTKKARGPLGVIGAALKNFFTSVKTSLKQPKRLIPILVLSGVWLILNILEACGITPYPLRVISFFTFAEGGMHGGFFSILGGIIGKGLFAGAVMTAVVLLTKRNKKSGLPFSKSIKGVFGFSADTLWPSMIGAGIAMFLFCFFAGGVCRMALMGGIAIAFLSARDLLHNGFLMRLVASFAPKSNRAVSAVVRGVTVGFLAATLLSLFDLTLVLIIAGAALLLAGIVLTILQSKGILKMRKENAQ